MFWSGLIFLHPLLSLFRLHCGVIWTLIIFSVFVFFSSLIYFFSAYFFYLILHLRLYLRRLVSGLEHIAAYADDATAHMVAVTACEVAAVPHVLPFDPVAKTHGKSRFLVQTLEPA